MADWFVVNAQDAQWKQHEAFGAFTSFETKDNRFEQIGVNIHVLWPGQPNCMYHGEADQEGFLVLQGECLVLIEEQEVRLKQWDFVHCPPWTKHVFVGVGEGPCAILMIGARSRDGVKYPVSELAQKHDAGVDTATDDPKQAYAKFNKSVDVESVWPLAASAPKP